MKLLVDTHTHTVASGHAYSTLDENARAVKDKGMEGFVCTDHGPEVIGSSPGFIIGSVLLHLPKIINGVRMVKGIEADIMDFDGSLDIREKDLKRLEFVIASLHGVCMPKGNRRQNTDAAIAAINNPYVDVIGHPGNPIYPIYEEELVKETARLNKLVEINNHSFVARPGSDVNCEKILRLCKRHDVRITVSSDAHYCYSVGEFGRAINLIERCGYPEELIVSATLDRFLEYLNERRPES